MLVTHVRPTGSEIAFRLHHGGGVDVSLDGLVTGNRHVPDGYCGSARYALSVHLIDPPREYRAFCKAVQEALDRRRAPRFSAELPVEFVEPPGLAATLTRNIAEGGAFIATDQLAMGARVAIRVALPGVPERMHAVGEVVRVGADGVGLKFVSLEMGAKRLLDGLLVQLASGAAPHVSMGEASAAA